MIDERFDGNGLREARREMARLRRAIRRSRRELEEATSALHDAPATDFPERAFSRASEHLGQAGALIERQTQRLREQLLGAGALDGAAVGRVPDGVD